MRVSPFRLRRFPPRRVSWRRPGISRSWSDTWAPGPPLPATGKRPEATRSSGCVPTSSGRGEIRKDLGSSAGRSPCAPAERRLRRTGARSYDGESEGRMKITLVRTGGVAGMRRAVEIDTDDLDPELALELERLVKAANLQRLSEP